MKAISVFLLCCISSSAWAVTGITYYHPDVLGSPVMATDATGTVKWRAVYLPFGSSIRSTESYLNSLNHPIGFTGHVHDPQTSLVYMQGRYYNPFFARFMGIDPAGFRSDNPSGFNRYAYANNNPYRYVDPNGEDSLEVNLIVVGFTVGSDHKSGQPFYKYRVGAVGLGLSYDPNASFSDTDIRVGKYESFNQKALIQGIKGRIGVSAGLGPFSVDANIVETQFMTTEIVDRQGDSSYSIAAGSRYLTMGESELSGTGIFGDKNVGEPSDKIGLQFRANIYYEYGETF